MSNNRTFFKNVRQGSMSLRDIFSDVLKKHTPEQSAQVLIAGTPLTTPSEADMLAQWQKPYLFSRFFAMCAVVLLLAYFMMEQGYVAGYDVLLVGMTFIVPVTLLLLAWEMNIPRDISLTQTLKLVAVGGMLSLIITVILRAFLITFVIITEEFSLADAVWAPLVEEPAKLAVIYFVLRRKNHRYILDGVLIGMAVGTGFAVMETLSYVMNSMRQGLILGALTLLEDGETFNSVSELSNAALIYGFEYGKRTAIVRGLGSIASHGTYAALYGGGLMIVKGTQQVHPRHLLQPDHLKYFLVSCLLHAANNSSIPSILEAILGFEYTWAVVETVVIMFFFLPLLRIGVNQVVEVCTAYSGGRVTVAVNRDVDSGPIGGHALGARLEFLSGPLAGKSFPLADGQSLTLGRSAGCDISIPGASSVSGLHCTVRMAAGGVTVTDENSTNGTYLGKRRLEPHKPTALPPDAVVRLAGSCTFRVASV